jgi:hypothetical protein
MTERPGKAPRHDPRVISIRGAREHNQNVRRLQISMIPKPLYGKNLRVVLGQYRWRKLRQSLLNDNHKCGVCETSVRNTSELNAHEEWSYIKRSKRSTARLNRISFHCNRCHGCEHFGRTLLMVKQGYLTWDQVDETIQHYCRVNRVSRNVFDLDLKKARAKWKRQSKLNWKIDYGQFASLIAEKRSRANRPRTKLRINPATDSEPAEAHLSIRRGPKPLFGRAMSGAERTKRARALKKQRDLNWDDLSELNSVPAVLLESFPVKPSRT